MNPCYCVKFSYRNCIAQVALALYCCNKSLLCRYVLHGHRGTVVDFVTYLFAKEFDAWSATYLLVLPACSLRFEMWVHSVWVVVLWRENWEDFWSLAREILREHANCRSAHTLLFVATLLLSLKLFFWFKCMCWDMHPYSIILVHAVTVSCSGSSVRITA